MSVSDNVGIHKSVIPKWLIAIAVGAPITVALGYYIYRKKSEDDVTADKNGSVKPVSSKKQQLKNDETAESSAPPVPKTPLERVLNLKNSGNQFFKKGKLEDAIRCYTEALSLCPPEETSHMSMLYQNRAACYESLNDLANVVKDATAALELNPRYLKALNRRCKAAEKLEDYRLSVEDLTTLCILEKFNNIETLTNVDRILKKLGAIEGKMAASKREPSIPSHQFIKSYFASFSQDPVINSLKDFKPIEEGDAPLFGLNAAKKAFTDERYDDIIITCNEQISSDLAAGTYSESYYQALLLRASIFILKTDYQRGLIDIATIVEDKPTDVKVTVNALIKRASVHLQLENPQSCLEDFTTALSLDPTNPDIYHHRGQIYLLLDKIDESIEDFNSARKYNPNSDLLGAQRFYTLYRHSVLKQNMVGAKEAIEGLKEIAEKNNDIGEPSLLLAQIYLDQQEFEKADKSFNKALEDDPKNGTILVHKGLLELQWHQDITKAVEYMEKAIEVDPLLEFAYETLASVEVQRGQLEKAVNLFEKALKLAKSEREMAHICALKAAAETQNKMASRLDITSLVPSMAFA